MKYPKKVERLPDRIPDVRHPEKVGCRSDRIAVVRHPGGMSENFRPDGMSAEKNSRYDILGWNERCHVSQGRGSHAALFREDPTKSSFSSFNCCRGKNHMSSHGSRKSITL